MVQSLLGLGMRFFSPSSAVSCPSLSLFATHLLSLALPRCVSLVIFRISCFFRKIWSLQWSRFLSGGELGIQLPFESLLVQKFY